MKAEKGDAALFAQSGNNNHDRNALGEKSCVPFFRLPKGAVAMVKAQGRAVFLDRDGTIILDHGYPREAQQVCLLAGAGEGLGKIKALGFALVLVSNQSGIGRGIITLEQAEQVHQALVARLAQYGVKLDGAYYCPHAPAEACRCRKPSPELFLRAAGELNLDLAGSFMVGDQATDMEAGKRAGCRTILLSAVRGDPVQADAPGTEESLPYRQPDEVARDWTEVVRHVGAMASAGR